MLQGRTGPCEVEEDMIILDLANEKATFAGGFFLTAQIASIRT
jgi:hypothetical protein